MTLSAHEATVFNRLVASDQPYVIVSPRRGKISEHPTLAEALDAWIAGDPADSVSGDQPAIAVWNDGTWVLDFRPEANVR